jgi:hypothetical protein
MDDRVVAEYSEALLARSRFPPVVVFQDSDGHLLLADGFHRLEAHIRAGVPEISACVYSGDRQAAIKCALIANATHGLRRTNADKRRAVRIALREFPDLSTHEIARMTGVSQPFVSILKREPVAIPTAPEGTEAHARSEPVPEPEVRKEPDPSPTDDRPPVAPSHESNEHCRRRRRVKPSPLALAQLMIMVVAKLKHAGLDEAPASAQWEKACNQLYALAGKEVQEMGGSGQKSARRLIRRLLASIEIVAAATPDGAVVTEAIDALLRDLEAPTGGA